MRDAASTSILLFALALAPHAALAAPLPAAQVAELCKAHEGKVAFSIGEREERITCAWIHKLAGGRKDTLVDAHRAVLDRAHTIDRLADVRLRPSDMDCAAEVERGGERVFPCVTAFDAGGAATFDYIAHADGWLDRVEIRYDYKSVYRAAMDDSVRRGKVSTYTSAYVDLQADLHLRQLRAALRPHDRLEVAGDAVTLVVFATPIAPPPPLPPLPVPPKN